MLDAQLEKVGVFYGGPTRRGENAVEDTAGAVGRTRRSHESYSGMACMLRSLLSLVGTVTRGYIPKPGMVFHIFSAVPGWTSIPAHEEWYTIKGIKPRSSRFHGRLIIFHLVNLVVMFNRPQSTHHSIRRAARWLENAQRYIHTIQTIICMRRRSSKKPF